MRFVSTALSVLVAPLLFNVGCATAPAPPTAASISAPSIADDPLPPAEQILLWPAGAPDAKGDAETDKPALTIYLPPKNRSNGTAIVVNPGGGYHVLVGDHEGTQVARWLNRNGIAAFVLRYRLLPTYAPEIALGDGRRAIRWVRRNAGKYGISVRRIGMMGFSAGGNLTAAVGTALQEPDANAADPIDRQSARPDFLGPIYPVISRAVMEHGDFIAADEKVTADTPPTFLAHTNEDRLSALHSVRFYEALVAAKVPAALHIFTHGAHGMGLAAGDPDLAEWTRLFLQWLRHQRFLTDAERVPIEGTVRIDGKPMNWGWVTLIPEDATKPIAATVIDAKKQGAFAFDAQHGPCAGRHRVELHVLSNPDANLRTGAPSLPDSEALLHNTPQSADPIWVDVKPGVPISVEIRR